MKSSSAFSTTGSQAVLIVGEPKSGKSNLALAFSGPAPSPPFGLPTPLSVAAPYFSPPGVFVSILFTIVTDTPADILCAKTLTTSAASSPWPPPIRLS